MSTKKSKILIAEDSLTQALHLQILLEDNGFEVKHAKDGKEGCQFLESYQPDLIISDVIMPHMSGFEFAYYVKTHEKFKHIPILLLTSLTDKADVLKGLASRANTFITKPYEKQYFLQTINNLLENQSPDPEIISTIRDLKKQGYEENTISFLISAYQTAINKNKDLEKSKKELKEINLSLEQTVKERTKELYEAKKTAERSDMLKSILLSNVSHDLRTPMNAILGFSELLKENNLQDEFKNEYLDLISKNGENLLNLINDIIDISKIEAGVIDCKKLSNCPVNELMLELEKTFQKYKYLKNNENIKLSFKQTGIIPNFAIQTDSFRLKQILSNLLSNAVKFTKKGFIEFSYQLIDETSIQFYVKDTGIGIPANKIENLFERYEQVKSSDNPETGTGLGLAIAKNLTNLLGGEMWLESIAGKGTTFYFTLPYVPAKGPVMEYFPKSPEEKKEYDFKQQLILIVEDDLSNYHYIKAVLQKANTKILWAKDGKQALEIFENNSNIKLILMDIHLPIMNGLDVTKRILMKNKDMLIIAQTAYAMSGDEEKCKAAGCIDYMSKPLKPPILLAKVDKHLRY